MTKIRLFEVSWQNPRYSGDYGRTTINASNAKEAIKKSNFLLHWIVKVELLAEES